MYLNYSSDTTLNWWQASRRRRRQQLQTLIIIIFFCFGKTSDKREDDALHERRAIFLSVCLCYCFWFGLFVQLPDAFWMSRQRFGYVVRKISSIQMRNHRNNNDVGLVSIHTRKRRTASLRRIILKNYFVKNNMRIVFVQVIKINSKQKNWVLKPHRHITHAYLFFTSSFVLMLLLPLLLFFAWFRWFCFNNSYSLEFSHLQSLSRRTEQSKRPKYSVQITIVFVVVFIRNCLSTALYQFNFSLLKKVIPFQCSFSSSIF